MIAVEILLGIAATYGIVGLAAAYFLPVKPESVAKSLEIAVLALGFLGLLLK